MVKIISLNIEANKHLDHVCDLLRRENADAVFLQEVLEGDVEILTQAAAAAAYKYVPLMYVGRRNSALIPYPSVWGMLAMTKYKPERFVMEYYSKKGSDLPELITDPLVPNSPNRAVLGLAISANGKTHKLLSTHFTWADKGGYNSEQLRDLENLWKLLDREGEYALCGDFNAPRGGLIYKKITTKLKDNIPPEIKTTLDNKYHRVKNIDPLVVDNIFSTPAYRITDVRVIGGVSDHKAVVADVTSIS